MKMKYIVLRIKEMVNLAPLTFKRSNFGFAKFCTIVKLGHIFDVGCS